MKLSVCTDAVFHGLDTREAMKRIKRAGYGAYEFWSWWDKDLTAVREAQDGLGLMPVGCCAKLLSMLDPLRRGEYLEGLEQSVRAADILGCRSLIAQCGADTGARRGAQREALIGCLCAAVPLLENSGVTLLLEPLNPMDHPGYYLRQSEEAAQIIKEVGSPRVQMLFDLYHQQISEGDLLRHVEACLPWVGHFHAASNPGRGELHLGELNYKNIFSEIEKMGYRGFVGLEYFPREGGDAGLDYALSLLR